MIIRNTDYRLPAYYLFILIFFLPGLLDAQGIKGKVIDPQGEPLPFASIILMGTNQGIASNIEGEYLLNVSPGKHRIRFQYLGYKALDTTLVVGQSMLTFNAVL